MYIIKNKSYLECMGLLKEHIEVDEKTWMWM